MVHAAAPSTLYSVVVTPEAPSLAARTTSTGPDVTTEGAVVLVGAVVSIRTVAVRSASTFPTASVER